MRPSLLLVPAFFSWACGTASTAPPAAREVIPGVSGPYLGQTPPGRTLQRFAPGIVPDWFHAEVTVSPDGQEIYWAERNGIMYTRQRDGYWTAPELAPFSGHSTELRYDDVPVISPDNRRLIFLSKRPLEYASPNDENIWYVERTSTGWSEPMPLPQPVNSVPGIHWQVSVAGNGTVYFSAGDKVYRSPYSNGVYNDPEPLEAINALGNLTCPFIAPDESYLIFTRIVQSVGTLYISFRDVDGRWLQPEVLNGIPAPTSFVSRDGNYLFASHYWISAGILEDHRPKP